MSPSAISNALMRSGETFQAIWDALASVPTIDEAVLLPVLGVLACAAWSFHLFLLAVNPLGDSHE